MILQALTQYYEALLTQGRLSPPGWDSAFKVSYGLELGDDGSLIQLIPYLQPQQFGKKRRWLPVPCGRPPMSPAPPALRPIFV